MVSVAYQPFPMVGRARGQVWRYAPQYRRPRHFHAELEVNLVTAGTGTVGVGELIFGVLPGDLLSWPPGVDHELLEASADFELYVMGATPEFSARVLGSAEGRAYGGPVQLRLNAAQVAELRQRCAVPPGEGGGTVAAETAIGDLWHDLQASRAADGAANSITRRVVCSLKAKPDLGRDRLARLVRTHPSELSRHFHRGVGLTLAAYRTRVRLARFIETVDRGGDLLSSALSAGFGSYSQCHRSFWSVLGCAPSRFFDRQTRREMEEAFVTLDESFR
ncbi:MAG TPA: helix-turn-helix transcriptional regulator [Polyangiaceae bacterium]|jgi:AraC-like DNA-binding protein